MREQPNANWNLPSCSARHPTYATGHLLYRHAAEGVQAARLLWDGFAIDDFVRDFPTDTKGQAEHAIKRVDNEYVRGIEREYAREHHRAADAAAEDGGSKG